METWCLAHPWMTLLLGLSALHAVKVLVRGWPPGTFDGEGD